MQVAGRVGPRMRRPPQPPCYSVNLVVVVVQAWFRCKARLAASQPVTAPLSRPVTALSLSLSLSLGPQAQPLRRRPLRRQVTLVSGERRGDGRVPREGVPRASATWAGAEGGRAPCLGYMGETRPYMGVPRVPGETRHPLCRGHVTPGGT
jgi:hypothetical protein